MLQLLCSHPDNEGLEMEAESEYDALLTHEDLERLVRVSDQLP